MELRHSRVVAMRVWWAVWVGPAELFVDSGCIGGAILWALAELSELFVGLGYTGEAIRWSRPCPKSYPMAHFVRNDWCGIRGPAVACRLLRCPDCVIKPVKASPAVSPLKPAPAVALSSVMGTASA